MYNTLCLLLKSVWEAFQIVRKFAVVGEELDVSAIDLDATFLAHLDILLSAERREAPVLRDDNLLAAREFVLRAAKSFDGGGTVGVSSTDGQQNLANVDTGDSAVWLAPGASHTSLQSIGTSARQHLVD